MPESRPEAAAPGLIAEDNLPQQAASGINSLAPVAQADGALLPETRQNRTICYEAGAELNRKLSKNYLDPVIVCE